MCDGQETALSFVVCTVTVSLLLCDKRDLQKTRRDTAFIASRFVGLTKASPCTATIDDDDSYQDPIPESRENLAPESKSIAQTSLPKERSEELIAPNKCEACEIRGKPEVVKIAKIDQSKVRPKKAVPKLKKAPEAPKRFKSAFIFFSTEKHKEIRARLVERGISETVNPILLLFSQTENNEGLYEA